MAGLIALLATALVFLLPSGAASAPSARGQGGGDAHVRVPSGFLGVLSGPTPFDSEDATKMARTRIRTVRISLPWYAAQRRRGAFTWEPSDTMIARMAAEGITVLPTLAGTPRWVAGKPTTPPVADEEAKDAWQTFVTAVVRRYGRDGVFWRSDAGEPSPFQAQCGCDAPPAPITAVQIWNEPNLRKYFTPIRSAKRYAELVEMSRSAIDEAGRRVKLVLGGLSDGGDPGEKGATSYLRKLYRVPGVKESFDAVAIHPYARNLRNLRTVMSEFRRMMRKHGDGRTPLWITEIGWGSQHPNRYGHDKGPGGQRRMLRRAMSLIARKRLSWRVEHAYWFFWRDPPKTSTHADCSFCTSAGLLWNSGHPKPAYKAYARLLKRPR